MLPILLAIGLAITATAKECPQIQSCSKGSQDVDPCCSPTPGGLFVFRQKFEPDVGPEMGSWGIDGLEVLESVSPTMYGSKLMGSCQTEEPGTETYSTTFTHEEIGSFCHRSALMGGEAGIERAEQEWAQSEVGEGVEEVWERAVRFLLVCIVKADEKWNTAGRYISTLSPSCTDGSAGEQVCDYPRSLLMIGTALLPCFTCTTCNVPSSYHLS
jgi:ribonuclease T2